MYIMKRIGMTASLKQALAFAFCCLCIFVYSQQASVLGGNAVQAEETECCKNCGSEDNCESGVDWVGMAWEGCYLVRDCDDEIVDCIVYGDYCNCDG